MTLPARAGPWGLVSTSVTLLVKVLPFADDMTLRWRCRSVPVHPRKSFPRALARAGAAEVVSGRVTLFDRAAAVLLPTTVVEAAPTSSSALPAVRRNLRRVSEWNSPLAL